MSAISAILRRVLYNIIITHHERSFMWWCGMCWGHIVNGPRSVCTELALITDPAPGRYTWLSNATNMYGNAFNRQSAVQCWVARRCCPLCGFFIGKQNLLSLHHGSSNNKHFYLIQLVTHYVQLHAESLDQITSDLKLSNLVLNSHETQKGLFFFLRHEFSETSSTKALLRRCQNTIKKVKQRQL